MPAPPRARASGAAAGRRRDPGCRLSACGLWFSIRPLAAAGRERRGRGPDSRCPPAAQRPAVGSGSPGDRGEGGWWQAEAGSSTAQARVLSSAAAGAVPCGASGCGGCWRREGRPRRKTGARAERWKSRGRLQRSSCSGEPLPQRPASPCQQPLGQPGPRALPAPGAAAGFGSCGPQPDIPPAAGRAAGCSRRGLRLAPDAHGRLHAAPSPAGAGAGLQLLRARSPCFLPASLCSRPSLPRPRPAPQPGATQLPRHWLGHEGRPQSHRDRPRASGLPQARRTARGAGLEGAGSVSRPPSLDLALGAFPRLSLAPLRRATGRAGPA